MDKLAYFSQGTQVANTNGIDMSVPAGGVFRNYEITHFNRIKFSEHKFSGR